MIKKTRPEKYNVAFDSIMYRHFKACRCNTKTCLLTALKSAGPVGNILAHDYLLRGVLNLKLQSFKSLSFTFRWYTLPCALITSSLAGMD